MLNDAFDKLRKRLTLIYTAVFGVIILVIVASAYVFIWWEIAAHEKETLIAQAYHETEEWLNSGEKPCSQESIENGSMLAYFVSADEKTVILNQLGNGSVGRAIFSHRDDWPKQFSKARIIRIHGSDSNSAGERYRYLAALVPVVKDDAVIGRLYMFKNIEFYYMAAYKTLFMLLCVALVFFLGAYWLGYYLAGISIHPIMKMYEQQKQFTADASHEMRTPLSVMRLAVIGMQEDMDSKYSSFAQESLKILTDEVNNMSNLTQHLLSLSRNDNGDDAMESEYFNISAMCKECVSKISLVASEKRITINTDIVPDVFLDGDKRSLTRLLVILLDNAIKYSPEQSNITVGLKKSTTQITLWVADEGEGISDSDKKKVFDRFYRVDKARSRKQGGFGLGLSLAQNIAKQHKTVIEIIDNKPKGTIMQIVFSAKK